MRRRFSLQKIVHGYFSVSILSMSLLCLSLLLWTRDQSSWSSYSVETLWRKSTIADRLIIFVRTSFHCESRLKYLLQSWLSDGDLVWENLHLITDEKFKYKSQEELNKFRNVFESHCPETHGRFDLCCKTASEFDLFYRLSKMKKNLDWLCRFDDDQYVNLNNLYNYLSTFDASQPFYIGRTSIDYRLKAKSNRTFSFATYGAGVCFSRSLLEKIRSHVDRDILPKSCVRTGISDDAYIGLVVETEFNLSLISRRDLFHSHLEKLDESFRKFSIDDLRKSISFGFAWDRYKLDWLPLIHTLIKLIDRKEIETTRTIWSFVQNYEKEHPEKLEDQFDRSCTSYSHRLNRQNGRPVKTNQTIEKISWETDLFYLSSR